MAYSYRFLDEVAIADLAFEASGDSLQELFRGATKAMIDAMADPATIGATWTHIVHLEDADSTALLFDWLSDLVYYKDAEGVVFSRIDLHLDPEPNGLWRLTAALFGAPVGSALQELRADVKGVTKHLYHVRQDADRWTARVVLDV